MGTDAMPDGKLNLFVVPHTHIDIAWKDGASCLAEACNQSGGEITGDQLKLILSRNERSLIQMKDGDETVGWGAIRVDQLPNLRALHITDLVCHNQHFERFFDSLKTMANNLGCSRIRCAAKPAQARLYRMKSGFKPVYELLEVQL